MDVKNLLKKIALAALAPVILLAGCGTGDGDTADIAPSEVVKAVLDQVSITSAVEKDQSELETYYSQLDTSKVESAAFCLCGSGAYPDEIAVIKFSSSADAKSGEEALQARLEKQSETYRDYTPDEMYKLETAVVYSKGNYAILLAVSDNEKAKSIVDEALAG